MVNVVLKEKIKMIPSAAKSFNFFGIYFRLLICNWYELSLNFNEYLCKFNGFGAQVNLKKNSLVLCDINVKIKLNGEPTPNK